MALLTDGKDDFVDKEYADFTAEMWSEGHSFFCYLSDSPDSLSSCCRLRNSLKDLDNADEDHNHTTHQYSMGTASVSTGSKSVMSMNLPRIIQNAARRYFSDELDITLEDGKSIPECGVTYDKDKLYEYIREDVREQTDRIHKYQTAFNETIKDFLKANMLDVYSAGFIDMRKQYLTVGVNGITDAAEFLGITVGPNDEYKEFVNNILETINIENRKDRTRDCMFNTEFVPGENLAAKNYKWDKKDGYWVSPNRNLYSSYFYNPEDANITILQKMELHGKEYVKYLDGGSALHANLQEHLSQPQYRHLMKVAAANGCNYFTFNVRNTVCNDCGYISKHTLTKCPHCGSTNLDWLTRVIGYLKRISSFAEPRQIEAEKRAYADAESIR
jgi:ribonucleoside-triphosphate reductase